MRLRRELPAPMGPARLATLEPSLATTVARAGFDDACAQLYALVGSRREQIALLRQRHAASWRRPRPRVLNGAKSRMSGKLMPRRHLNTGSKLMGTSSAGSRPGRPLGGLLRQLEATEHRC